MENQKKIFEEYAILNHFNPRVPDRWYVQPRIKIINFKVFFFIIMIVILLLYYLQIIIIGNEEHFETL